MKLIFTGVLIIENLKIRRPGKKGSSAVDPPTHLTGHYVQTTKHSAQGWSWAAEGLLGFSHKLHS